MQLMTLRLPDGSTTAARRTGENTAVALGFGDVGKLLEQEKWQELAAAEGEQVTFQDKDVAPVVPRPGKVICVGLNYANHIQEMGRELPKVPTLFIKFADALTGPFDDVNVPEWARGALDWEGELAVVIGKRARRVVEADAASYIAGYAVANDYTMRDYQYSTLQWHQGKSLEKSAGFGPWLTTRDEWDGAGQLTTRLNGEVVQNDSTSDLVFTPEFLIEYISHIYPLNPGDTILTGTPGGVGHARDPKRYVGDGDGVTIEIEGLGRISNRTVFE